MTTTIEITPSAPANLRDLGGIRVTGGVLREQLAIRSDDLSTIPSEQAHTLAEAGLATVIDLRTGDEIELTGRGPLAATPVAYHHLPLMRSIGEGMTPQPQAFSHERMGEMYVAMVERAAPQLALALTIIALSPGTTAFHCSAGRDRTGVLAALLLLTLGASEEEIVNDYTRTEPNMPAIAARSAPVTGVLMRRMGFDMTEMNEALGASGSMSVSMQILLARLRERHGDPLAPIREAGLGGDTIARLRTRAVTP